MAFCNICKFQVFDNSVSVCPNCGAPLENPEKQEEAAESISRDTILRPDNTPGNKDDDLQICDPGDLLCSEQAGGNNPDETALIGQTSPPLPSACDDDDDHEHTEKKPDSPNGSVIKKLSDEQVDNIRSNLLNGNSDYVSAQDASSIIHDLSRTSEGPTLQRKQSENSPPLLNKDSSESTPPADAPESENAAAPNDLPPPKTAPMRKVAYFHKNFIQITGSVHPATGEEMVIDDRHYLLKQKKIKPQYTIGVFSILVVLLLFVVGKQFISPTLPGSGSIIGVILDETGRPLISGAEIALPESGKKTISNPIGFFRFDNLPTGVYIIRYTLPDGRAGVENISVAKDEITLLSLITDGAEMPISTKRASKDTGQSAPVSRRDVQSQNMPPVPDEKKQQAGQSPKPQKAYSEIQLRANVEGAKLVVNGEVLGAGNMTYKKLAPGDHKAKVTKTGYKGWSGNIHLKPNETYTLSVTLEEVQEEGQETAYSAEDFYQSGRTMLADGNMAAAIQDFTEALNIKPSMADAYTGRAEAYLTSGKNGQAEADYIRAGEIYMSQKRDQSALNCFNKAIGIHSNSVAAFLNRADLHRRADRKNEAIDDYRTVLKHDKDNFRAHFELGKIYFATTNHKDADKMLRKAQEIDARNPEVYHYLMLNYFARDDFGKVKKIYVDFKNNVSEEQQQAFRDNPRFDAIHRIVGEYERP